MTDEKSTQEQLNGRRRRVLSALGGTGVATLVAGCFGGDDTTDDGDTDRSTTDDGDSDGNGDDGDDENGDDENGDDENGGDDDENGDDGNGGDDDGDDENGEDEDLSVFELTDLEPAEQTAEAVYGATFDLTATVENTGETAGTQELSLSVGGGHRQSVSVDLEIDEERTVEFTGIDVFGLEPGATYDVDVASNDGGATATLEIEDRPWSGTVGLETLATEFPDRPVAVESPPDSDRLYIVERTTGVFVYEDGELLDELFLDLSDDLVTVDREDGVMGIEFHPEFEENRRCFVSYTAEVREGTPSDYHNTGVVSEFEVSEDGLTADRDSERTIIEIPSPYNWHNTTSIDFGPDDYLYIATGDGGSAGDPGDNGQSVENLLGAITRIDVDAEPTEHYRTDPGAPDEPDGETGYAIPEDNPLVGEEGADELYAWGLRSPWGVDFDGEDYYVADVGQGAWEEVNIVEKGGNYGWNIKEGTHCYGGGNCPDTTSDGEPLIDPIIEYPHDHGICVIGGLVYRGNAIAGLDGQYIFGDLIHGNQFFVGIPSNDANELWDFEAISIRDEDAGKMGKILAFAEDPSGELLIMGNHGDAGTAIHRVVPAE